MDVVGWQWWGAVVSEAVTSGDRRPVLVVLGEGGHTSEMLNLVDQLDDDLDLQYVMVNEDEMSEGRIRRPGPIHRIRRPNAKDSSKPAAAVQTLLAQAQAFWLLARVRPRAILSSGPAVGIPIAVAAKLVGADVIFVETIARVTGLSMTGRLMRPLADLYFVQWPGAQEAAPGSRYEGRLV
jgi:beta-1,4-N-acetylglucosaminyltransferase